MADKGTSKKVSIAKARAIDNKARKIADRFLPPQVLHTELAEQQTSGFKTAGLHYGRFVKPDGVRDSYMQAKNELATKGSYGSFSGGKEDIDYFLDKKAQEEKVDHLRLAELLVDPDHPASQAAVYEKFPELKSEPDAFYHEQLAICEALRNIIRDGTVNGPEDLELIRHILRPDTTLPLYPAWDPTGLLVGAASAEIAATGAAFQVEAFRRGFFNPRQWGVGGPIDNDYQKKLKILIAKRCFPALRNQSNDVVTKILAKTSPATGGAVSNAFNSLGPDMADVVRQARNAE